MNPVYWAERRHQRYVISTNRTSALWIVIAGLLLVPAMITALIVYALALLGQPMPVLGLLGQINSLGEAITTLGLVILITMNAAQFFVVMLVSTALASDSIARERRNHTWDLILLSAQPAGHIARGKIWASLWALRRDHLFVLLLRLGLLGYGVGLVRDLSFSLPGEPTLTLGHLLLLTLAVLLWSGADAIGGAALSVASAALPGLRAVANLFALSARTALFLGGAGWIVACVVLAAQDPFGSGHVMLVAVGSLVLAFLTGFSVLWASVAVWLAGASRISQNISQPRHQVAVNPQQDIPKISQDEPVSLTQV